MTIEKFLRECTLRILLVSTSMILAFLVVEFLMRFSFPPQGVTSTPKQYLAPKKIGFVPLSEWKIADPEYTETVRINSLGYRDEEIDPAKETILFLGDSQTFGTGVNQNERISDYARHYVDAHCPTVNILNVSMPGASTFDEKRFLDDIIKKGVKVRHVFLNVVTNDHFANEFDRDDPQEFDDEDHLCRKKHSLLSGWIKKHRYDSHFLKLLIGRLSHYDWFYSLYTKMKLDFGVGEFRSLRDVYTDEERTLTRFTYTRKALEKIKKTAPLSLILIPDKYRYEPTLQKAAKKELQQSLRAGQALDFDRESRLLQNIAQDLGISLLDPTDSFRADSEPQTLTYPLNGHLTVRGHRMVADAVLANDAILKTLCSGELIKNESFVVASSEYHPNL